MNSVQNTKQKQIKDIVSIVKLASLLLTGIILCKYIFKSDVQNLNSQEAYFTLIWFFIPLMIFLSIYFMWTFSNNNKLKGRNYFISNVVELIMFIIIFTGIIYLSGGYESQYKFLFLFIISEALINKVGL